MKPHQILTALAAALICGSAGAQTNLDVYVLGGQSNMAGVAPLTGEPSPSHPSQIWMWDVASQSWVPAKDPIFPGCGVGPGLWFADSLAGLQPGHQIGVVPVARNGSYLSQWMPTMTELGTDYYGYAISEANKAAKACNGNVKGWLWYQGEAETMAAANVQRFSSRMHCLFSSVRADFNNLSLPIVFVQLGPDPQDPNYPYWTTIQNWQAAIAAAACPNTAMVSAKDLTAIPGNPYHLDQPSQLTLGGRMGNAMYQLLCAQ